MSNQTFVVFIEERIYSMYVVNAATEKEAIERASSEGVEPTHIESKKDIQCALFSDYATHPVRDW